MNVRPGCSVRPVGGALLREALGRLLYGPATPSAEAITRFIATAPDLGIDLSLIAATVEEDGTRPTRVLQACMPVVGAGRTAMIFVSGPGQGARFGSEGEQAADRAAAVLAGLRGARDKHGEGVSLVQALAEPGETWATEAFQLAGLRQIAELLYMSRPLQPANGDSIAHDALWVHPVRGGSWPGGVRVRPMRPTADDNRALEHALELSYEGTLDCPELAGLRTLSDIVASHRAVGEFDHRLWWLVERSGAPEGCVLLNRCAQQRCVELVYIGLAPGLRGLGLGAVLLEAGVAAAAQLERELRCAVDVRNEPARRMYARHGFHEAGRRLAFVGLVDSLLTPDSPSV